MRKSSGNYGAQHQHPSTVLRLSTGTRELDRPAAETRKGLGN